MTKLYSCDAIVIRTRDFGEADKILTLFTREYGRIQAIAKGVRKPASRLRGGVQPFTYSRMLIHRGKSLDLVTQAETREVFAGLREDLDRLTYASYFAELMDAAFPEKEPHEEVFILALTSFGLLMGEDPELAARFFEIRLLHFLGFTPFLTSCLLCGQPLGTGAFFLDPEAGGLTCRKCRNSSQKLSAISSGSAIILQKLLLMDPRMIFRLKVSFQLKKELEEALAGYLEYHLEKTMKAMHVIKSIKARTVR